MFIRSSWRWSSGLLAIGLSLLLVLASEAQTTGKKPSATAPAPTRATGALRVITGQPGSVIFINNVRHGAANEKGELVLPRVKAGSFPIRVRTTGFADWNGTIVIAAGGSRTVKLTQQQTTDQATLHFHGGEDLRDKGKNAEAVKEYEQALALRPVFAEAQIALTRSLIPLQDFEKAEKNIQAAIRDGGRTLAEAQTVLANLRRHQGLTDESIVEYRKAIRFAKGISAEAHVGLAIALNEAGDVDGAVKEYRIGIAQDMDTEPILYYQLGEILEKANRNKEAIEVYHSYLRLDPEGEYASAVESIIERLKEESNN